MRLSGSDGGGDVAGFGGTEGAGWTFRLIRLVVCLFIVLSLNFALPRIMPGDPVLMLLGPEAVSLSERTLEALRSEYGLDRPFAEQYLD